jgi:hypothetical protein
LGRSAGLALSSPIETYTVKKTLLFLALAVAASPAWATKCNNGATNYPTCTLPTPPTTSLHQDQNQHQTATATNEAHANGGAGGNGTGVGQGGNSNAAGGAGGSVAGSGNSSSTGGTANVGVASGSAVGDTTSRSSLQVGDTSLSAGGNTLSNGSSSGGNTLSQAASADSSGNSAVNIDSSRSDSYTSQALFLPTIQNAAPALTASAQLIAERSDCGPRVEKRSERVYGTYVGVIKKSQIDLGLDDDLLPADEPYRYWTDHQGVQHVFGHQLITFASVNGVAASRSLGLGGGKTGGDWGQAGASSGSSVQRTVLRVQVRECEIQLAPREVPVYVEVPAKKGRQ